MAVYKIFPIQDATLYSLSQSYNTGLDAICEISNKLTGTGTPEVTRYVTLFDDNEIQNIIDEKINNTPYNVYFNNFIALAQGLNLNTSISTQPLAQPWNNGTGKYGDNPQSTDGVSWSSPEYSGSINWNMSGSVGMFSYTGSYDPSSTTIGGGCWFTTGSLLSTQSFSIRDNKDIELDVTNIVNEWYNNSIPNYGFITKLTESAEFNSNIYNQPILKYYSVDTNTIYPPQLEFRWRDFTTVLTGSLTGSIVTSPNLKLALNENPGVFYPDSINRFKINVSPLYPVRTFQTSSYFTNQYFLPTSSYYAVKDLDTNEFVIKFDDQYTQISADAEGNYFDIYMNGLEPERYYSVLIKTIVDGSTIIFDDQYYFKVING